MFQLDDQFLADIGLNDLPEDQKKAFLEHIYSELELRVGTKLSDGLSDAQLEEFEKIIDRDEEKVREWLSQNAPDYQQDEAFARIVEAAKLDPNDNSVLAEYTATKWLEKNRPDYRDVVAQVMAQLKTEIVGNKDTILGNDSANNQAA